MLLPRQRRFIKCEINSSSLPEAILQVILLSARQPLRNDSGIDGEIEVYSSADVLVKEVEAIAVLKHLNMWKVPEGFPSMQTCLPTILYHLSTYFGGEKLLRKARNISEIQRSWKRRARLNLYFV